MMRLMCREILQWFPVGSEWYDCAQDSCGVVAYHFEPRGLFLRWHSGGLALYGYSSLVTGRLIVPREGGYYHEYREDQKRIDEAFTKLVGDQAVWS